MRFSFPVDLIRDRGEYQGNMVEKVYPGVHSDVGGGYEPGKQGRKDSLARIPLQHMLAGGIDSGVRMFSLPYLLQSRAVIAQRITADKTTSEDYAAYVRACGAGSGTVEQQMQRHKALYYAYRGTQHRAKVGTASANEQRIARLRRELDAARKSETGAESTKWREFAVGTVPSWWQARKVEGQLEGRVAQLEAELEAAETDAKRLAASDDGIAVQAFALQRAIENGESLVAKNGQLVLVLEKHRWMLDAWQQQADSAVTRFFDNYVHDSRTDFLGGLEPFVYFRNRGQHEQARHRTGATGSW